MSEEKKESQGSKTNACCHSGCCGGKKFLIGILVGVILFAGGYWFAKANLCANKVCPFIQMQK